MKRKRDRKWWWRHVGLRVAVYGSLPLGAWLFVLYTTTMPGQGRVMPRELDVEGRRLAERLRGHVVLLASEIGERNLEHPRRLSRAEAYLENQLNEACPSPVEREAVETPLGTTHNLSCTIPGEGPLLVLGAHFDTADGTPGANDNASGTAALLELCARLAERPPKAPVRCALFTNEEPPWFWSEEMGSLVHARASSRRGDEIFAMIALESLGMYSSQPGSQHYPKPMDWLYPATGDFVAFVGNLQSRALVRRSIGVFRQQAWLASEGAALPNAIPSIGWSDHWSFWQIDVPALMVTDTATFRDSHYHQASDTPDHLNYEHMARVVIGLEAVVRDLAGAGDLASAQTRKGTP